MSATKITTREKDSVIECQTSQGEPVQGNLLRLTHHSAAFESYNPATALRLSEVLSDFKVTLQDRVVYAGKATVSNSVNTGTTWVCEARLEDGWQDLQGVPVTESGELAEQFQRFVREWQKHYKVGSEYKVAVADLHTYLFDLRLWLEQLEWRVCSDYKTERSQREKELLDRIAPSILESLNSFFDRFEVVAQKVPPELAPVHQAYTRRLLHPLVLSSPFVCRTFQKPLGYAGDYEMVNMIARKGYEGASLFGKVVNAWFLEQPPAAAHRNRMQFLFERLRDEIGRRRAQGSPLRVYSLGCGPALEIQQLLQDCPFANSVEVTLVDFNEETLQHAGDRLKAIQKQARIAAKVSLIKKNVTQLLKEALQRAARRQQEHYDFVYCAGLFDYFQDSACEQFLSVLYEITAPGGLLVATNVDESNPRRQTMEAVLDWILIYRDGQRFLNLKPQTLPEDCVQVHSDFTGVNTYLEIRKPNVA